MLSQGPEQMWQHEVLRQEDADMLRGWNMLRQTEGTGGLFLGQRVPDRQDLCGQQQVLSEGNEAMRRDWLLRSEDADVLR